MSTGLKETGRPERQHALIVCAHLRRGRTKRRSKHFLQPISGLHIGSLIDQARYEVTLYHEDWHGPYDTRGSRARYDIVFLTGLQPDFDRMRQLSYHFRREGAVVVAGGSICTLFPEFAAEFFDVVCVGGVDSVADAIADFEAGRLKPIYRSPQQRITEYRVDYGLFNRHGIRTMPHLIEASRGCNFRCSFCVVPAEGATHTSYRLKSVADAIENAIVTSPRWSLRRLYPMLFFVDNNFSDNRADMLAICDLLRRHRKVRAWGALVTQNILRDHELIQRLGHSKCVALFVGLEFFDPTFLRRFNKKQNLSRHGSVIGDIAHAERQGICIMYGYLFDPRAQMVAEMEAQIAAIVDNPLIPPPTFYSVILPLAGTASFWEDAAAGRLAPNLRLRDLDGETIAYSNLADAEDKVEAFVKKMALRPHELMSVRQALRKVLWRTWNARGFHPLRAYLFVSSGLRAVFSEGHPANRTSYFAGDETLDPQYAEYPRSISREDWQRYFAPIQLTDENGHLASWLSRYAPSERVKGGVPIKTARDPAHPVNMESARTSERRLREI